MPRPAQPPTSPRNPRPVSQRMRRSRKRDIKAEVAEEKRKREQMRFATLAGIDLPDDVAEAYSFTEEMNVPKVCDRRSVEEFSEDEVAEFESVYADSLGMLRAFAESLGLDVSRVSMEYDEDEELLPIGRRKNTDVWNPTIHTCSPISYSLTSSDGLYIHCEAQCERPLFGGPYGVWDIVRRYRRFPKPYDNLKKLDERDLAVKKRGKSRIGELSKRSENVFRFFSEFYTDVYLDEWDILVECETLIMMELIQVGRELAQVAKGRQCADKRKGFLGLSSKRRLDEQAAELANPLSVKDIFPDHPDSQDTDTIPTEAIPNDMWTRVMLMLDCFEMLNKLSDIVPYCDKREPAYIIRVCEALSLGMLKGLRWVDALRKRESEGLCAHRFPYMALAMSYTPRQWTWAKKRILDLELLWKGIEGTYVPDNVEAIIGDADAFADWKRQCEATGLYDAMLLVKDGVPVEDVVL